MNRNVLNKLETPTHERILTNLFRWLLQSIDDRHGVFLMQENLADF